jgi:DNA polymerase delta subunit 4
MPTTRRSAGSARGHTSLTKGQSTLSFHSKVTKNVTNDAKKAVASPPVSKVELPTEEEDEVDDVVEPDTKEDSDEEAEAEPEVPEVPEKTESELRAEKVTNAQIDKYWKAIEKQRISPQVHQEGVTTNEKILRYFDVSSQYGVSRTPNSRQTLLC